MKRVFVYLQHDNNKPIKIEVKDMDKFRGYLEAGKVKIKQKWYNIITEDIEVMLDWWDEPTKPKINKSSRVSVDTPTDPYSPESRVKSNQEVWEEYDKLKAKVKHFKSTGVWLND